MWYKYFTWLTWTYFNIALAFQVIGTLTIFVKQIKRTTKRKDMITVFDLISYIINKALLLIGKGSQKPDCRVHTNVSSAFTHYKNVILWRGENSLLFESILLHPELLFGRVWGSHGWATVSSSKYVRERQHPPSKRKCIWNPEHFHLSKFSASS